MTFVSLSDDRTDDSSEFCRHGYRHFCCRSCDEADDFIESKGGIDKCLNCGRYRYGDQLTREQVCLARCVNPAEY